MWMELRLSAFDFYLEGKRKWMSLSGTKGKLCVAEGQRAGGRLKRMKLEMWNLHGFYRGGLWSWLCWAMFIDWEEHWAVLWLENHEVWVRHFGRSPSAMKSWVRVEGSGAMLLKLYLLKNDIWPRFKMALWTWTTVWWLLGGREVLGD